ncbi:MAG: hypothetical protein ACYCUG_00075 [Acidimicrobiales bacterium]
MPTGILKAVLAPLATAVCILGWAGPAWASGTEGQNTTTSATTGSGGVTVSAGYQAWLPPSSPLVGQATAVMDHTGGGGGGGGPVNPNAPYACRYQLAPPITLSLLGPGGPGGGQWVFPICAGPGVLNPMPPIWVPTPTAAKPAAAPASPAVSPLVLARQAVSQLRLAALSIHMAPPTSSDQLVGLASWLWVTGWQPRSASATAGPVSATVTAAPVEVVWDLDGHQVTCPGAGTAYQPGLAAAAHTSCSYTWTQSSAGAPGGVFPVTATVYWQVTWSAHGAPGGGSLGRIAGPPARAAVAVAEAQAINTTPGQAG